MNNDRSVSGILLIVAAIYGAYLFTLRRMRTGSAPAAGSGGLFKGDTGLLPPAKIRDIIPRSPGAVFTPPIRSGGIERLPAPPPLPLPKIDWNR